MCSNCIRWANNLSQPMPATVYRGRSTRIKRGRSSMRSTQKAKYLEMRVFRPKEPIEYVEGDSYTDRELDQIADQFLRDDARTINPETGKPKGISGENPILFEEHLSKRKSREIMTRADERNGIIDPAFSLNSNGQRGMYNREAPDGRKVNTEEQRKKNGASWYRN